MGQVLDRVSLGANALTSVADLVTAPRSSLDRITLGRIGRERDAALARYRRERDTKAWTLRWPASTRRSRKPVAPVRLKECLPTWQCAICGSCPRRGRGPGRRMLAESLFERIDVLSFREATIRLTDSAVAHGFAAAIPERLEVTVGNGRGERARGRGNKRAGRMAPLGCRLKGMSSPVAGGSVLPSLRSVANPACQGFQPSAGAVADWG